MISFQECLDLSGLNEDEIRILAEQRHIPEIVAIELANSMLETPKGIYNLKCCLLEALEQAKLEGLHAKAKHIDGICADFCARYPAPRIL